MIDDTVYMLNNTTGSVSFPPSSRAWLALVKIASLSAEKADLLARIDWMFEEYSGCDWCDECGGGDREMRYINARLAAIDSMLLER